MLVRIRKAMTEEPELLQKIVEAEVWDWKPLKPLTDFDEGLKQGARRQLLRLLTVRFASVPEDVETRLQSVDLNQLEELVEVALVAETIAQFANHL